jgi:hypothetical protein
MHGAQRGEEQGHAKTDAVDEEIEASIQYII